MGIARIAAGLWENRARRWFSWAQTVSRKIRRKLQAWEEEEEGNSEPGAVCLVDEMHVIEYVLSIAIVGRLLTLIGRMDGCTCRLRSIQLRRCCGHRICLVNNFERQQCHVFECQDLCIRRSEPVDLVLRS